MSNRSTTLNRQHTPRTHARSLQVPEDGGKSLAAMVLAAFVAALLVATDSIVDIYADGNLLAGWIILWAVGFGAIAMSANAARKTAGYLSSRYGQWAERRAQARSDAYLMALARKDPRVMADIQAATKRAEVARQSVDQAWGRAWLARHPVGTFNAGYQGSRHTFRATPLAGLPTHWQYLQG